MAPSQPPSNPIAEWFRPIANAPAAARNNSTVARAAAAQQQQPVIINIIIPESITPESLGITPGNLDSIRKLLSSYFGFTATFNVVRGGTVTAPAQNDAGGSSSTETPGTDGASDTL